MSYCHRYLNDDIALAIERDLSSRIALLEEARDGLLPLFERAWAIGEAVEADQIDQLYTNLRYRAEALARQLPY